MDKVCPIVLRPGPQILAFRHPLAGLQLVKGTIEPGEDPADAATRELQEEAGLTLAPKRALGNSDRIMAGGIWHFFLMAAEGHLPDRWKHHTDDDGGNWFAFFWHPLAGPHAKDFAPAYRRAMEFVAKALTP